MSSKSLLTVLWLVGTVVAATVAWQSLRFVSASTEGEVARPARIEGETSQTATTQAATASSATSQPEAATTTTTGPVETPNSGVPETVRDADAIEQTFDLVGGRAVIRFSPTEILVVWATPAPGYTFESHPEDGGVEVEFNNGVHESKLEAWWADGPRSEIRERDD